MASFKKNAAAGDRGVSGIVQAAQPNSSSSKTIANYKQDWPRLWTCIGQECIGRIYERAGNFGAFDGGDTYLGCFPSLIAARSAIWAAHVQGADKRAA